MSAHTLCGHRDIVSQLVCIDAAGHPGNHLYLGLDAAITVSGGGQLCFAVSDDGQFKCALPRGHRGRHRWLSAERLMVAVGLAQIGGVVHWRNRLMETATDGF